MVSLLSARTRAMPPGTRMSSVRYSTQPERNEGRRLPAFRAAPYGENRGAEAGGGAAGRGRRARDVAPLDGLADGVGARERRVGPEPVGHVTADALELFDDLSGSRALLHGQRDEPAQGLGVGGGATTRLAHVGE